MVCNQELFTLRMQVVDGRRCMTAQSKPKGLIFGFVDRGLGVCRVDDMSGIAKEGFDVSLMGDEEALLIFAKRSAGQGPHDV